MKKCDYFKDLILTDYIDAELDNSSAEEVQRHLLGCSDCRALLNELENNLASSLHRASRQPTPEGLWDAVRRNIEQESQAMPENQRTDPISDFINGLKGLIGGPRMVPVFASLIVMLLAGSVTVNTIQVRQAKDKEQGEYLVSLLSVTASQGDNGLGTPIEQYFL